jgi:hypothetical protein
MRMSLQTSQRSSLVVAPHWFLSSLCIDSGPVAWSHRLQLVEGSTSVTVLYETLWGKIAPFHSSPSLTSHGQNPPAPLEIGNHRESHSSLEPLHSDPTSANFGKSTRKVSLVMLPASTIARFVTPSISRSWTNTVNVMIHATQSSIGPFALSESRTLATRLVIVHDRSAGLTLPPLLESGSQVFRELREYCRTRTTDVISLQAVPVCCPPVDLVRIAMPNLQFVESRPTTAPPSIYPKSTNNYRSWRCC